MSFNSESVRQKQNHCTCQLFRQLDLLESGSEVHERCLGHLGIGKRWVSLALEFSTVGKPFLNYTGTIHEATTCSVFFDCLMRFISLLLGGRVRVAYRECLIHLAAFDVCYWFVVKCC